MLEILAGLALGAAVIAVLAWAAVHEIIPTYQTSDEARAAQTRPPWDVRQPSKFH